ncbi:hypothetical protein EMPS_00216 [Entomortierella parvispora]|uniref:Uncharacterized protein n=1 Tax=Entomortierella parvispora TaxID=205924 RepID=A0A9P3LRS0_9FUNG|nr:hypothetical protein EMPS_00216 [Entomortierella parvispora]
MNHGSVGWISLGTRAKVHILLHSRCARWPLRLQNVRGVLLAAPIVDLSSKEKKQRGGLKRKKQRSCIMYRISQQLEDRYKGVTLDTNKVVWCT